MFAKALLLGKDEFIAFVNDLLQMYQEMRDEMTLEEFLSSEFEALLDTEEVDAMVVWFDEYYELEHGEEFVSFVKNRVLKI